MSNDALIGGQWRVALAAFCRAQGVVPRIDEPLRRHGTWRIGGPADLWVEPGAWSQVAALLRRAHDDAIPTLVIGKGSNLLFSDRGVRGAVIKIGPKLAGFSTTGRAVRAQAGLSASRLARATALAGLSGFEHIVGIPGTLGGLVVMNGGSLRRTIGEAVVAVRTIDRGGAIRVWQREECAFAYRHSRFQGQDDIITEVTLQLATGSRDAILTRMRGILRDRRRKFPLTRPSCGSVFKSDAELVEEIGPAGRVIEQLGFKGRRVGDAQVDTRHANFIVNVGDARARDVVELVADIRRCVRERLGYTLTCEVKYVDESAQVFPLEQAIDQPRI